jgi:hypothetical protein
LKVRAWAAKEARQPGFSPRVRQTARCEIGSALRCPPAGRVAHLKSVVMARWIWRRGAVYGIVLSYSLHPYANCPARPALLGLRRLALAVGGPRGPRWPLSTAGRQARPGRGCHPLEDIRRSRLGSLVPRPDRRALGAGPLHAGTAVLASTQAGVTHLALRRAGGFQTGIGRQLGYARSPRRSRPARSRSSSHRGARPSDSTPAQGSPIVGSTRA